MTLTKIDSIAIRTIAKNSNRMIELKERELELKEYELKLKERETFYLRRMAENIR